MTQAKKIKAISGMPCDLVDYIESTGMNEGRLFSAQAIQLIKEARAVRENIANSRTQYGVDTAQPGIPPSVPVE